MTLITCETHPDAEVTFNGINISAMCMSADAEEGWAEVFITVPPDRREGKTDVFPLVILKDSDEEDAKIMKVKIYGKVEIDLKGGE